MTDTPRALGYRMPAEWEPHEATWLSWPHNLESWPGKFDPVPAIFAEIVAALHEHEEVRILAGTAELAESARETLATRGCLSANVRFFPIATNDAWMRDHGPIFVKHPERGLAIIDWKYNAWGGKYPPFDLDDAVPERINERLRLPIFRPGIVLEGGSIDVNGSRCVGFDMGLSLFRPVVRVLGGEGLGLETSTRCARGAALGFRGSGAGAASSEVSDRILGLTIAVGVHPPRAPKWPKAGLAGPALEAVRVCGRIRMRCRG